MFPFRFWPVGLFRSMRRNVALFHLAACFLSLSAPFTHNDAGCKILATSPWLRVVAQSQPYQVIGILVASFAICLDHFATKNWSTIGDSKAMHAEPEASGAYAVSSSRLGATESVHVIFNIA